MALESVYLAPERQHSNPIPLVIITMLPGVAEIIVLGRMVAIKRLEVAGDVFTPVRVVSLKITAAAEPERTILIVHHVNVVKRARFFRCRRCPGVPIEIVSKVILRHANLSDTAISGDHK